MMKCRAILSDGKIVCSLKFHKSFQLDKVFFSRTGTYLQAP